MIWLNPWAWLGLSAIAAPILIHLLARRKARLQQFPTLRFLGDTPPVQARRSKLTDLLLLVLRVAVVAAAVAALAHPLLLTSGRTGELGRSLARVIVLDTSASMNRATPIGQRAVDAARATATQVASGANTAVLLATVDPASALEGAAQWLAPRAGRREIVVLSDFQTGSIDSLDLSLVPAAIGVRLVRSDIASGNEPATLVTRHVTHQTVGDITIDGGRTAVSWRTSPAAQDASVTFLTTLASPGETANATAAVNAAREFGTPAQIASRGKVVIVHPEYERDANILSKARPLSEPWMGDLIAAIGRDSLLLAVAATAELSSAARGKSALRGIDTAGVKTIIARNYAGEPVVAAALVSVAGEEQLALFSHTDAGSLASAALVSAVFRSASVVPPVSELNAGQLAAATLRSWEREPSTDASATRAPEDRNGPSDARWFWILALLLLGVEWLVRRARDWLVAAEAAT